MERFTEEGKVVGVVLDLSLRHLKGRSVFDGVRAALVGLIPRAFEEDVDGLYLYGPAWPRVLRRHGEQVAAVSNHRCDGWAFGLSDALAQTLWVVGAEDPDLRKYVALVSDRLADPWPVERVAGLNRKDGFRAALCVVALGSSYQPAALDRLAETGAAACHRLADPAGLAGVFLGESPHADNAVGPADQ